MPAKPRWLLAIPDAIRQLEQLDRALLTRRDLERLFGVSKVRTVALMTAFGAGRTGHLLTLPRAALLRQLRRHRTRAAFRGAQDAVGRLFALAQALTNDYEQFEALVEEGEAAGGGGALRVEDEAV